MGLSAEIIDRFQDLIATNKLGQTRRDLRHKPQTFSLHVFELVREWKVSIAFITFALTLLRYALHTA